MANGEEKLVRLKQQRGKEAIDLAMQGRWRDAVEANRSIIEDFPEDVEAHNRLGRAYTELGEYAHAREAYGRTVHLDPYNAIARKNLQRLARVKETAVAGAESNRVDPQNFIEEIGKAGVVNLYNLAPPEVLAKMVAGAAVTLKIEGLLLKAENAHGDFLGETDPRHAQRLTKLMEGGNKYSAAVVSSSDSTLRVIIRETFQDPSQAGRLSFPPRHLEEVRPHANDRLPRVGAEEEADADESGYTVVGGEEVEVLHEEPADTDEDADTPGSRL